MPLFKFSDGKVKVSVYKGDITMEKVDAIVNAADENLSHGGGVAKAILDRAGKAIRDESRAMIRKRGLLNDGEAVTTKSGNLFCRVVIHAVGPKWEQSRSWNGKRILRQACLNAFSEAEKLSLDSIAVPAIGSGVYGVPKDVCAEVMLDAVEEYITKVSPKNKKLTDIRLVDLDDLSVQAFQTEFLCRYGDKVVTESSNNLKAQPRSNRGRRGKGKGSKGSGSTNNSPGSSDARDDHPLSAPATSYSGAVKRNVGEKDGKAPTTADGANADKEEEGRNGIFYVQTLYFIYRRISRYGHLSITDSFQRPDKILIYFLKKIKPFIIRTLSNTDTLLCPFGVRIREVRLEMIPKISDAHDSKLLEGAVRTLI